MRLLACFLLALIPTVNAQCPDGGLLDATRGQCLLFFDTQLRFQGAEDVCRNLLGHLVSFHNAFQNSYVAYNKTFNGDAWIGGSGYLGPGDWSWVDGSRWDYNHWSAGQPSLSGSCALIEDSKGTWKVADCQETHSFVCLVPQIEASTTPPVWTPSSSSPRPTYTPSPSTWPTPGPTSSSSRVPTTFAAMCCDDDSWVSWSRYCYKTVTAPGGINWNNSVAACQSFVSTLASIHSDAENDFVYNLAIQDPDVNCSRGDCGNTFIGLVQNHADLHWLDGTALDYTNFPEDEPDQDQSVVAICTRDGDDHIRKLWYQYWDIFSYDDYPVTHRSSWISFQLRNAVCKKNALPCRFARRN